MCILCVIQKWSRRVATMLPWLVIPLIGLWALSQLLPPAFRFEITSPRLACVSVLLITLFWYEILMPQLSSWRVRRNARLRERKRFEAIELQKLRKTATRRCRNCLTPYRDQNPGGGKFMCSYCGHISKRPVLDLPVPPGSSGIIKDLVGKSGKLLNGKAWSDNGWLTGQDWLENGHWVGGPFAGNANYWQKNGGGYFGGDDHCMTESSYSGALYFALRLLMSFFFSIRWLWRKIFRISSSSDDDLSDDHRGLSAKRGENGENFHESRGEKARRKAEEKRQARIERELLEEEERKQREEVARLVEERRRLRDEKSEAEKDRGKGSTPVKEKNSKKEAEKKRQERKKDKDKGSSKSNSDVEELERKASKESERNRRDYQKTGSENVKGMEMDNALKPITSNVYNRGNAGTRYFDRVRGSFFGNSANPPAFFSKDKKPSVEYAPSSVGRRELYPPERVAGKVNMNGEDRSINPPVMLEPQLRTTPKKTWQQLFTRSSPTLQSSTSNVISRPNGKSQAEVSSPMQSFENPINFGIPSPFNLSGFTMGSTSSISEPKREAPHNFLPEEPELFEDPCYVPDPVSLLGPVSESLDNFQLDLGTGFIGLERPRDLKNVIASSEVTRPSPIESPLSRLRVADEKYNGSNRFPVTPKAHQDLNAASVDDLSNGNEKGTWQMWNTTPLGQDGLGLVGGSASWLLPPEKKTMASLFTKGDQVISGTTHSPQKGFLGDGQNNGMLSSSVAGSSDHGPWLQTTFFQQFPGNENHLSLNRKEETSQNDLTCGSPGRSTSNHPFEPSPANCWSKTEWAVQGSEEGTGMTSAGRPHIGGLYSAPDVQSLWSFD